jgi:hypothetical protein
MTDRTDAQRLFVQFQAHVERLLDTKIKCVQSDWGGEYQKLHTQFFTSLGIAHRVSCPHTHQQNGSPMPLCRSSFGMKPLSQQPISSIDYPLELSTTCPPYNAFSKSHPTILC